MPRLDSRSCFGRLLGWDTGGYCRISPVGEFTTSQEISGKLPDPRNHLRDHGQARLRLLDFFPMRKGGKHEPHTQILRIVGGAWKGVWIFSVGIVPRFDFGAVKPWIQNQWQRLAGGHRRQRRPAHLRRFSPGIRKRHDVIGEAAPSTKGQRLYLSMLWRKPEDLDAGSGAAVPKISELERRLEESLAWWRKWSAQGKLDGPYAAEAMVSALVLKGLTNAPTGAIAAAATTSLPEAPGGTRNWDYRYTWVRDSVFSVSSLRELGFAKEADGFRRFIERSAAGSAEELQILFGLGGERRIFRRSRSPNWRVTGAPRRSGSATRARTQMQLDVYGELLDLAWRWHGLGYSPDDDYWEFLVELINGAAANWDRARQRHLGDAGRAAPFRAFQGHVLVGPGSRHQTGPGAGPEGAARPTGAKARDEIRRAVEEKGLRPRRGVFTQAFDSPQMDASLLLVPLTEFVDYRDQRMIRTVEADPPRTYGGRAGQALPFGKRRDGGRGRGFSALFLLARGMPGPAGEGGRGPRSISGGSWPPETTSGSFPRNTIRKPEKCWEISPRG